MIFVTLGTQDKEFQRLLDAIQKQIDNGIIKERIVVQAGCTKYNSPDMEIFDLISSEEFNNLMSQCDILITHGGVGSIVGGLKNKKKVIAAARLKQFNEHTNDHQLQIIQAMEDAGYIVGLHKFEELDLCLKKAKKLKVKEYKSNTDNIINYIADFIDNN